VTGVEVSPFRTGDVKSKLFEISIPYSLIVMFPRVRISPLNIAVVVVISEPTAFIVLRVGTVSISSVQAVNKKAAVRKRNIERADFPIFYIKISYILFPGKHSSKFYSISPGLPKLIVFVLNKSNSASKMAPFLL
jgi:hypothetical protein